MGVLLIDRMATMMGLLPLLAPLALTAHELPLPTMVFRSNFTEPSWVAIYHIPVLLAIPLPPL